jgi:hypothetical protein
MINVDKLRQIHKDKQKIKLVTYAKILKRCCDRIELIAASNHIDCWYCVPNFVLGTPLYDLVGCCLYLKTELDKMGFTEIKFYAPNIFYISWE